MENKILIAQYFPPSVIRLGIILSIVVAFILFFITNTAKKAHSESDLRYRQESVFEKSFEDIKINAILDNSLEDAKKIAYAIEVDKITPTPTPSVDVSGDEIWYRIAACESHVNWKADTGNGYYGGLQFSLGAWMSVGGSGKPSDASSDEQIMRGKLLQQKRGWGPWGACSKKLGLI